MPIHKKQKGGIIDDPANCNDVETPIYFDKIKSDSDVIYVGNELEGNKYNCFSPIELKDIILDAENKGRQPINPLTREPLSTRVIRQVKRMFPENFDFDEPDRMRDSDPFIFKYYDSLNNFNLSARESAYISYIELFSTLDLIINKYPETLSILRLQENRSNPLLIKIAKILTVLYELNNLSIRMITDTDLLNMFRTPQNIRIALATLDDEIIGGIIYRDEPIEGRITAPSMNEYLTTHNIRNNYPWVVSKIITISVGLELIENTDDLIKQFIKDTLSDITIMRYPDPEQHTSSMLIISYNQEDDNDADYSNYIRESLGFFDVSTDRQNEIYYITDHTFSSINNSIQGGLKKVFYKRRNSKKKLSKKKSPKSKLSKRKSSKRKSSKRKSNKRNRR